MQRYTTITVIYNPNSTGSGESLARLLQEKLAQRMPQQPVDLVATQHAGHAETLAYDLARASARPLVISASGDGGYNEVINGLLRAQQDGAHPVAGLLPAGNANDHFHHLHRRDIAEAILAGDEKRIDVLRLRSVSQGKSFTRYAHSYIGFGLTPEAGRELNKTKLNRLKETIIVFRVLLNLKPVPLIVGGRRRVYDSLIFSNIDRMSKILTISATTKADDGTYVVTAFHRRNKLQLMGSLLKASIKGLKGRPRHEDFRLSTVRPTLVQLDGEMVTLDAQVRATISLDRAALRCVV